MSLNYKKNRAWAENFSIVMQLGLTMAGCILFCFYIGWQIDKWLGIRGAFTVIFIILGILGGGNVVYRQILEVMDSGKKDRENSENGVR